MKSEHEAEGRDCHNVRDQGHLRVEEEGEVRVVPLGHAGPEPRAVVVEEFHAVVAAAAVLRARGPHQVARVADLQVRRVLAPGRQRGLGVRRVPRDHARVDERGPPQEAHARRVDEEQARAQHQPCRVRAAHGPGRTQGGAPHDQRGHAGHGVRGREARGVRAQHEPALPPQVVVARPRLARVQVHYGRAAPAALFIHGRGVDPAEAPVPPHPEPAAPPLVRVQHAGLPKGLGLDAGHAPRLGVGLLPHGHVPPPQPRGREAVAHGRRGHVLDVAAAVARVVVVLALARRRVELRRRGRGELLLAHRVCMGAFLRPGAFYSLLAELSTAELLVRLSPSFL